jgi:hypothetical protein
MQLSFRQIGEHTGISRKRAARIYRGCLQKKVPKRVGILDPYHGLISHWFHEYPSLKALQVYTWLTERGVAVSYPRVAQYTRELRRKKDRVYHPLTFLPGEEAQVDWCFLHQPGIGKLCCFVFILSYSRYLCAHLFPRSSFEFFIEGHLMAFSALKGVPHSLRYDNLKSVVLKRTPEVQYNPRFLEFCRHYGIQIRLCTPRRGNEKGRVERVIRTMKETFFTAQSASCLKALNKGLHEWVEHKNHTPHRATGRRPVDLLQEETLKPLPQIPWHNETIHPPVKTTKTALMLFDCNAYSVPEYLVGRPLSVHATPTMVKIYEGDKEVAAHPRCFERYAQIINPLHRTYGRLSQKAKYGRIHEAVKNLDPVMANFLLKNQGLGEDPQKTAYEIFILLKKHSRGMLISIAQECIRKKSPRLRTFLSYLTPESKETAERVLPQHPELLTITYTPRPLEVYDEGES